MRVGSQANYFSDSIIVKLKNDDWLKKQRIAGKVAAGAIELLINLVKEKSTMTLLEMSRVAEKYIVDNGCSPTFKGYAGGGSKAFPEAVCVSVNAQLVHGVPTDYVLSDGDLVSFDLGATFEGAIADTATTVIYGKAKSEDHIKLIDATKEALKKGIQAARVGNRIGNIGEAIYKSAKRNGYNVNHHFGGHSLDWNRPHASPFISNKSITDEGIRIQPELTIAIEPLLTIGSPDTWIDKDGWTVNCKSLCAHEEHTIYIHKDKIEIITKRQDEN